MIAATTNTGHVAWIAGVGATGGLGAAVARRFAREGLVAAVTGRTAERVEAIVREIREAGGVAHAFVGDVSREADVLALSEKVSALGPLDVAVFNAARAISAPSRTLNAVTFENTLRTTTVGGFVFGREAVRRLLPLRRGTLLFTGASAPSRGRQPFGAFMAAKAALRSISQRLACEFGPRGIHVAHVVVDDDCRAPRVGSKVGRGDLLAPSDIADVYWQLHSQPRSAWTQELDLQSRP